MATPTTLPNTFVAGNVLTAAQMNNLRGAFRILQISVTQKADTFTSSSTTYTDLTGLSASITPSDTNNKILVGYTVAAVGDADAAGTNAGSIQIVRGSTAIGNATAAGSRTVGSGFVPEGNGAFLGLASNWFLDSPTTTSATTYKLQIKINIAGTVYVNRTRTDTDTAEYGRVTSSLILCEVSA